MDVVAPVNRCATGCSRRSTATAAGAGAAGGLPARCCSLPELAGDAGARRRCATSARPRRRAVVAPCHRALGASGPRACRCSTAAAWCCCGRCSRATVARAQWLVVLLAATAAIDAGLWFRRSAGAWYVGLGSAARCLGGGPLAHVRRGDLRRLMLAVFLVAKLAVEQCAGRCRSSRAAMPVVVDAHLYGALGGARGGRVPWRAAQAAIIRGAFQGRAAWRWRSCFPVRVRSPSACWRRSRRDASRARHLRGSLRRCSATTCGSSDRREVRRNASTRPSARNRRCWSRASRPGGCGTSGAAQLPPCVAGPQPRRIHCAGVRRCARFRDRRGAGALARPADAGGRAGRERGDGRHPRAR